MAIVTRRYRWVSTTEAEEFVAPSATVLAQYVNVVDLQVNDAVGGTTETLDEYMETLGYVYDPVAFGSTAGVVGIGRWSGWLAVGSNISLLLTIGPNASYQELIMPRAGHLLAMSLYVAADLPLTGTAIFQPRKGTPTAVLNAGANIVGASGTLDGATFPRNRIVTYTPGLYTFVAGDKIGINLTTNATAGANTYTAQFEVSYN